LGDEFGYLDDIYYPPVMTDSLLLKFAIEIGIFPLIMVDFP
jgi:hypothetical protein